MTTGQKLIFSEMIGGRDIGIAARIDKTAKTVQVRVLPKVQTTESKSPSFAPDGHRLASSSSDSTIRIWDLPTGRSVVTLRGHGSVVRSLDFSPDGNTLASCSYDAVVKLWETASLLSERK